MLVILVLIVIFGALAYLWAQKKFRYWSDRGITSAPTTFPYGNLKGLGREIPTFLGLDKIYKSFKGATRVLGIYFFVSPTLMILDIELLKDIYIREFTSFHDRSFYYNKEDDPLSANLVRTRATKIVGNLFYPFKVDPRGTGMERAPFEAQPNIYVRKAENDVRNRGFHRR